jgi:15-cis-phytoene synthase
MATLYAFCREVDDVADEEKLPVEHRRAELQKWRQEVRKACAGGRPELPVIAELQPAIQKYRLPFQLFDELLQGVEMDLDTQRYPDYEALDLYCYRVASVVGLLSIEIFEYQNPKCREYAVHLGKALQLTNILRDVRNDAERGRIYLPLSELDRFGVRPEELLEFRYSDRFRRLAESVAQRARSFYCQAQACLAPEERRSMATAELMGSVYWRLLQTLEQRHFNVFNPTPTRLSRGQKLFLILRTWYRMSTGALAPNYGAS